MQAIRAAAGDPVRLISAFMALGCACVGIFLASHHPLAPQVVLPALLLWSAAVYLRPAVWLFVVPALLAVIDLAPWTGWLTIEENDILVLGAAIGGYASIAIRGPAGGTRAGSTTSLSMASDGRDFGVPASPIEDSARLSGMAVALIALYAMSTGVGLYLGVRRAAEPDFGWFDGYFGALNSLRIAKGFGLAVLMLPLLRSEMRRSGARALKLLASGLATGLGAAALVVLWERAAFPGVLNFSSDYRATGPFWEMHVGGAALDGFLALTAPFAVWEFLRESHRIRWVFAGGLILVAGYACLATFSRGVYLALPVSFALLAVLRLLQRNSLPAASALFLKGCGMVAMTALAAFIVFRAGGYRSLLAVLGVLAMTLPMGTAARGLSGGEAIASLLAGAGAGAAGMLMAPFIPKGPYVVYGIAFLATAVAIIRFRRQPGDPRWAVGGAAAYVALVVAAAAEALGWGGFAAFRDSAIVLSLISLLTLWNARARAPLWPDDAQEQGVIVGVAALLCIATAVFSGGAYMTDRFSSSERDLDGRLQHWREGIGMLNTPADWAVGKGLGRFPQSYYIDLHAPENPGSYRIDVRSDNRFLELLGPRHDAGFGEMLRVSQRVPIVVGGQYSVVLDARAPRRAQLHLEICEKHLLYNAGCAIAAVSVNATGDSAQRMVASLDGRNLSGGPWYAPRLAFFAMAVESPGGKIEIDNVSLFGPDGRNLLANGDFAEGMSRWFSTSDRLHLPWHIKNIGLNVLFDQGVAGLLLFVLLVGGALWRLTAGKARAHPMAPFMAAALAGFLVVGLFDSLLDVPRVAFLFFLLVLASLALPETSGDGVVDLTSVRLR